jgi:hypothetical protein
MKMKVPREYALALAKVGLFPFLFNSLCFCFLTGSILPRFSSHFFADTGGDDKPLISGDLAIARVPMSVVKKQDEIRKL